MKIANRQSASKLIIAITVISLALYLGAEVIFSQNIKSDIAYVDGKIITINSQVSTQVLSVPVDKGERVLSEDLLISLDSRKWEAKKTTLILSIEENALKTEAANHQHATLTKLLEAQANYKKDRENTAQYAISAWEKQQSLGQHSSQRERDLAFFELADRMVLLQESEVKYAEIDLNIKTLNAEIEQLKHESTMLKTELLQHQSNINEYDIRVNNEAQIHAIHISEGAHVVPGQALITLVPSQEYWITAHFKETELPFLTLGTSVSIVFDAYPNTPIKGQISAISPLAGAALGSVIPNYSAGSFTRIVQRIPIKITFSTPESMLLSIGLSAKVSVQSE